LLALGFPHSKHFLSRHGLTGRLFASLGEGVWSLRLFLGFDFSMLMCSLVSAWAALPFIVFGWSWGGHWSESWKRFDKSGIEGISEVVPHLRLVVYGGYWISAKSEVHCVSQCKAATVDTARLLVLHTWLLS
jgi:hypothetical protein